MFVLKLLSFFIVKLLEKTTPRRQKKAKFSVDKSILVDKTRQK